LYNNVIRIQDIAMQKDNNASTVTLSREDYLQILDTVVLAYDFFVRVRTEKVDAWRNDPARLDELLPTARKVVEKDYKEDYEFYSIWPQWTKMEELTWTESPNRLMRLFGAKDVTRTKMVEKEILTFEDYLERRAENDGYSFEDKVRETATLNPGQNAGDKLVDIDYRLGTNTKNPFPDDRNGILRVIEAVKRTGDEPVFNISREEYDKYANLILHHEKGELPYINMTSYYI
jgi:hypothetical protein